jgi:tetratricopeptide (TPR) repeat protein
LYAARGDAAAAGSTLAALIRDTGTPGIARATALAGIGPYLTAATIDVLPLALSDPDPMVRAAAVGVLEQTPLNVRVRLAFPMLDDPVRAVRIETARVLAAIPAGELSTQQRASLETALQEYATSQLASAERPEAQANLGNLYAAQGKEEQAVAAYNTAIDLNRAYVPAYVNLADLYRAKGKEADADKVLRKAAGIVPDNAAIHHALGLSLVRQQRAGEGVEELRLASILSPDDARYVYVYAVALNSTGKQEEAIMVLQGAHNQHPNNRDILSALVAFLRDMGNEAAASTYAGKLRELSP